MISRSFSWLLRLILLGAATVLCLAQSAGVPSEMDILDDRRILEVGDRFSYHVVEEREQPITVFISGTSDLKLPLIGSVDATGETELSLAKKIKARLEETYFYQATVVLKRRVNDRFDGSVYLLGAVRNQGEQPLPSDDIVRLSALILGRGGFAEDADRSSVTLVRRDGDTGEEERAEYDVGLMLDSGDFSDDPVLRPGDLVLVKESEVVGQTVYVLGAVNQPGEFNINTDDFTLSQAILAAGGFTRFARTNRVKLVRTDEEGETSSRSHNMDLVFERGDRSKDPVLKSGDVIRVDERLINF